jgi:tetratricopeptide (TPR) repeat protein
LNNQPRYRAYISYSHKDEKSAAWLHRALESYRVPRYLVGTQTPVGEVPARIRPIFRDRDDLSSAIDLKDTVKHALAESENLILICSPDSAVSPWVNEEVRQFAALGRASNIFCVLVGGQPAADGSMSSCFPSALAEIGFKEPLAADVRKWADGKHVAMLKLIAGLLGIRLDELRQRDLQRRRKRQFVLGLGVAAMLTLAVLTIVSQVSERHQREKAEQLANFIVDLGERLKSDVDLETLALIGAESSRHLQSLDPHRLSPETGKKVALAIRQMASVNQYRGKPDKALKDFERSRDLLWSLHKKYPQVQGVLFELGNAEYYVGKLHFEQKVFDSALTSMQSYHQLTRKLSAMDSDNPDWILEVSYSHNNLAAVQLDSGMGINESILEHVAEAIRLMEIVVALKPDDKDVASAYATTLAWAADAQFQACNLEDAIDFRRKTKTLSEFAMHADPANNDLKKQYAYALTGVARLQSIMGQTGLARQNLELAINILKQLVALDPSNFHYRELLLYRQVMLSKLLADTGELELAGLMIPELKTQFQSDGEIVRKGTEPLKEYIELLLAYVDVEFGLGNINAAREQLQIVMDIQADNTESHNLDFFDRQRLVLARYQWWQINDGGGFDKLADISDLHQLSSNDYRSCIEADSSARMYFLEGNMDGALREVVYLKSRGYADPGFVRFCQQNKLCQG